MPELGDMVYISHLDVYPRVVFIPISVCAEKKVISKEEAKVIEEKNLYWQDMFRQAVFLDMNHSYNRLENY